MHVVDRDQDGAASGNLGDQVEYGAPEQNGFGGRTARRGRRP